MNVKKKKDVLLMAVVVEMETMLEPENKWMRNTIWQINIPLLYLILKKEVILKIFKIKE